MRQAIIGVLALQGDFAAHAAALRAVGADTREVRSPAGFAGLDGLVIPGGESSAMLKLLEGSGIDAAVTALRDRGGVVFGTCAGCILLARQVRRPEQASWGLLDITVERNAFGRQVDSFEAVSSHSTLPGAPLPLIFIRAPRIRDVGPGVEVLAEWDGEPVLVRQGRVLGGTFHPEWTADLRVHRLITELAAAGISPE